MCRLNFIDVYSLGHMISFLVHTHGAMVKVGLIAGLPLKHLILVI